MHSAGYFENAGFKLTSSSGSQADRYSLGQLVPKKAVLGLILAVALLAFELFNFDTTRYALQYMLGDVSFWGLGWATILAIALCAIDFAGLARLFTPERGSEEPRAIWYLMGAWLLGATMNASMTWWAVSLTLLSHDFGNEVLSRDQLLRIVPMFVAALVWLTRVLFIGALSVAGEHLFERGQQDSEELDMATTEHTIAPWPAPPLSVGRNRDPAGASLSVPLRPSTARRQRPSQQEARQRPLMPDGTHHRVTAGLQAQSHRR
jgi:hypothetical protein